MRSPLDVDFAANKQALKLWEQLQEHGRNKTAELTFGMIDPIVATQMVGQQTIYISGALCGFGDAECSGADTSDYPWDTVPKVASRMFRSQRYHDRRQRQFRLRLPIEERRALGSPRDFLQPIVADADMGFGSATAIVKLVQALVEAGVAMFHLDDLAIGAKRFTTGQGPAVVPTSEYLARLCAARMQLDIMGSETLLMARCDIDGAQYITSNIDPRDHAFILGATAPVEPLAQVLARAGACTPTQRRKIITEWETEAKLMTFDEAVRTKASSDGTYAQYLAGVGQGKSQARARLQDRRDMAASLGIGGDRAPIFFDWELPRSQEGYYRYHPSEQAIINRCIDALALSDVTWARMDLAPWDRFVRVHTAIRAVHPDQPRLFAAGYSAAYDFASAGFTEDDVRQLHHRLAELGVVWQLQPGFAMQGLNYHTRAFSEMWAKEGMGGYLRDVQKPAMEKDTDTFEKMEWCGGFLADSYSETVASVLRS